MVEDREAVEEEEEEGTAVEVMVTEMEVTATITGMVALDISKLTR